jgi:hypothetical protein
MMKRIAGSSAPMRLICSVTFCARSVAYLDTLPHVLGGSSQLNHLATE